MCIALHGNPPQSYRAMEIGASSATWDHTVPPERAQVTPAMQIGTRFTYPRGMEG